VDLNEAVRRIFLVHRKLIFLCAVLGLIGGLGITAIREPTYTAATRLTLGGLSSGSSEEAVALADSAEALATSRAIVQEAVRATGLDRDPIKLARNSISVKTLGSSDLVQLEVTDAHAAEASELANALGERLVDNWAEVSGGQDPGSIAPLQEEISKLRDDRVALDEQITLLEIQIARERGAVRRQRLEAKRDVLSQRRDELERTRLLREAQLSAVLVEGASRRPPQVIDPAVPPGRPDPKHEVPTAALGAFLGALVGICLAALVESLRPTLSGSDAIADALGVPMLGSMPIDGDAPAEEILRPAMKVRFAATAARARTVELVPIGPTIDLSPLSDAMEALNAPGRDERTTAGANGHITVHRFGVDLPAPPSSHGTKGSAVSALVAVAPSTIKRSDLREIGDLQALTSWPLDGLLTYERRRRKWRRARRSGRVDVGDERNLSLSQPAG
jgi:capsular polysaccharide biosynthesis protein